MRFLCATRLTFSTAKGSFSRDTAKELIREIYDILPKYGLSPHPQKTQIVPPGARKVVLGLLVDGERVRLSKDFRNKMECHWYYCAKDVVAHADKRGFESIFGLKNYINGLIAYAKQVDAIFVEGLESKYGHIVWPI